MEERENWQSENDKLISKPTKYRFSVLKRFYQKWVAKILSESTKCGVGHRQKCTLPPNPIQSTVTRHVLTLANNTLENIRICFTSCDTLHYVWKNCKNNSK